MNYKTYEVRVYDDGTKQWFLNGKRHREDGPAIEWTGGSKEWYLNGERHRKDGPAIEKADGVKTWYLNDKYYSKADFHQEMARREMVPATIKL